MMKIRVYKCDCDGYTSSAILINYLCDLTSEDYINKKVSQYLHTGKQHGLQDAMDQIGDVGPDLVIIPDAGSNDIEQLIELLKRGIDVIILDHHEIEDPQALNNAINNLEEDIVAQCCIINSQLPQYPNKELSGAGVVYQFCRYVDKITDNSYADWYLDLVALGLDGDMMSLKSMETRFLISEGLKPANIHNPFIFEMQQKNKFKLGDFPTAQGATFYIVPLVNAINRSGTLKEKELVFNSMLTFKAFKQIPSNKRGHKIGETERLVDQAIRTCTNVKNRQGRIETAALELVDHLIEDNNMMEHKVLLFLLEPGQVEPTIRGLVANKLMAKYQRPCCMLTKTIDKDKNISYQGSARGCDIVGVTKFKSVCAATQSCDYAVGHEGAFGLGLPADKINDFLNKTDNILKDMPSEPIYYVDYIQNIKEVNSSAILDIADLAPYQGKDIDEALVAIQGIQITKNMIQIMASNTVKISLPNGVAIIKFRMPDEEYNKLISENGYVEINAVCKCNKNEQNGNISAQLLLEDYEIINQCAYVF